MGVSNEYVVPNTPGIWKCNAKRQKGKRETEIGWERERDKLQAIPTNLGSRTPLFFLAVLLGPPLRFWLRGPTRQARPAGTVLAALIKHTSNAFQ